MWMTFTNMAVFITDHLFIVITMRDLPSNEFKQGHFTKVPLLLGRDSYEGYAFSNTLENTTAEENADLQPFFLFAKQSFF